MSASLRTTRRGLARSYQLQAAALARRGVDSGVVRNLRRAAALDPNVPGTFSALALAEISLGRFAAARRYLQQANSADSRDLDAMCAQIYLLVQQGDTEGADEMLAALGDRSPFRWRLAFANWPDSVPRTPQPSRVPPAGRSNGSLKRLYLDQRWEAVAERLQPGLSAEERLWVGEALVRLGHMSDAVAPLEQAHGDPELAVDVNYWLARCYAALTELAASALAGFEQGKPLQHLVRAEIALKMAGDGPKAAAEYAMAIEARPADPSLWAGMALAQFVAGEWRESRRAAEKALDLDPNRPLALRTLGEVAMQERDYKSAALALERLQLLAPDDVSTQFLLGAVYVQTRRNVEALDLLRSAEQGGFPDERGRLAYLLGTVLRRMGRYDEAEAAFEQSERRSDAFALLSHGPGADADIDKP